MKFENVGRLSKTTLGSSNRSFLLIIALSTLLAGCVHTNMPSDIEFASTQAVEWGSQSELDVPARGSGLPESKLSSPINEHRPLIKVDFISATNLARLLNEHSAVIGSDAFVCSRGDTSSSVGLQGVFYNGQNVFGMKSDQIENRSGKQIPYYFYLEVIQGAAPKDIPPRLGLDHWKDPHDVCFSLRGGNSPGLWGFRSNRVEIPKAAIVEALRNAPPDFGRGYYLQSSARAATPISERTEQIR